MAGVTPLDGQSAHQKSEEMLEKIPDGELAH